jgi:CRISPR-associated endonuclease Cas1
MAAAYTVPQPAVSLNPSTRRPRHGVITLAGYGISIRVERGHLLLEDGIGQARRRSKFARIGHDLRRLIVIGADGVVSLAALRWLADQKAAFVMLDRDGTVLAVTGPVRPSDLRLRRAQGLAHQNETAVSIARDLISRKLFEQKGVAAAALQDQAAVAAIESLHAQLDGAHTLDDIRKIEAFAAMAYWGAWRSIQAEFPRHQLPRVPTHWRRFTSRHSSLTGTPRLATDPVNAILNYLYAILEAEARLAAATLGLDPGLGVLHADTIARDNLACDLMEPIRPLVDAYVL